jgi:ABC-type glutathione transport system ATPase component
MWFSVEREPRRPFEFEYYPRYFTLASQHYSEFCRDLNIDIHPRLVSFIGTTGAGKSTIIRMLIERPWLPQGVSRQPSEQESISVPVVGKQAPERPESGDVHLYRDHSPSSLDYSKPLFMLIVKAFNVELSHHQSIRQDKGHILNQLLMMAKIQQEEEQYSTNFCRARRSFPCQTSNVLKEKI